jgi:hypothetical protein
MLEQRLNPNTGKKEYCLVSTDGSRVLEWYGKAKPSLAKIAASERRVQFFKHKKGM